ncbi:MAG: GIY-YIG nuclease family protein [Pseudomonadota bacterium]
MNREDTCIYRFFDSDTQLLWIGITQDIHARFRQHRFGQISAFKRDRIPTWYQDVVFVETDWVETRERAAIIERHHIATERPKYNKQSQLPKDVIIIDDYVFYADIMMDIHNHSDPETGEIQITPQEIADLNAASVEEVMPYLKWLTAKGIVRLRVSQDRAYWVLLDENPKARRKRLCPRFQRWRVTADYKLAPIS